MPIIILEFIKAVWKKLKLVFWFAVDNWKVVLPAIVIIFVAVFVFRSCGPHKAKLNEKEILDAQTAIEQKNDKQLKDILVNADVREKQVDMDVSNAKAETFNARVEAQKKYANMSTDDLSKEIESRK